MKKLMYILLFLFLGIVFSAELTNYKYLIPAYWWSYDLNKKLEQIHNAIVIVNPSNGNFDKTEDVFKDEIKRAHNGGNLVVGYIYTKYGQRDINEVKKIIDKRLKFYPDIEGFFLDEVSSSNDKMPYYEELYNYIKSKNENLIVILNPGTTPDEKYFRIADNIVVYEDSCDKYKDYKKPDWLNKYPEYKISYLGYDCDENQYKNLEDQYSRYIHYFTDDGKDGNPWDSLSSYLLIVKSVSEEKVPPYNFSKFRKFLDYSKLTYPIPSDRVVDYGKFAGFKSDRFYADKNGILYFVLEKGDKNEKIRNELRWSPKPPKDTGFDLHQKDIYHMIASVKLMPLNKAKEYTFLQIHSEDHPLLRMVVEKDKNNKQNYIWAVIRITAKDSGKRTERIDFGPVDTNFHKFDIALGNGRLVIKKDGKIYVDKDVSRWPEKKNYFKAGIYDSKKSEGPWIIKVAFDQLSWYLEKNGEENNNNFSSGNLEEASSQSGLENYKNSNIKYGLWIWRPSFANKIEGKPAWYLLYDDEEIQDLIVNFVREQDIKRVFLYIGSIQREREDFYKKGTLYNPKGLSRLVKKLKDNKVEVYGLFYVNDNPNDLSGYEKVKDLVNAIVNYNNQYPFASFDGLQSDQEPYKKEVYPVFVKYLQYTYDLARKNNLFFQIATKPSWVVEEYNGKPFIDTLSGYVDELALMDYYDDLKKIENLMIKLKGKKFSVGLETSYINVGSSNTFFDDIEKNGVDRFKKEILSKIANSCKSVPYCIGINIHNFTSWYYLNYSKEPYQASKQYSDEESLDNSQNTSSSTSENNISSISQTTSGQNSQQVPPEKPRNTFTAKEYQKKLGVGINVNWVSSGKLKKYLTFEDVKAFKQIGFDTIRLRITDEPEKLGFKNLDEYIQFVKQRVNRILKAGLIPVLSFSPKKMNENPSDKTVEYEVYLRKKFAEAFKDMPYIVSYDLTIEPGGELNKKYQYLLKFYDKIIPEIRRIDPYRILMVAGPSRSNPEYLHKLLEDKYLENLFKTDKYLMIQFHFLAAGPFRSEKKPVSWTIGTDEEKKKIEDRLKIAVDFGKKLDIPLRFGAWMPGNYNHTYDKGNNYYTIPEQIKFATFFTSLLRKYHIPFAINAGGQFYDYKNHKWNDRLPVVKAIIQTWKQGYTDIVVENSDYNNLQLSPKGEYIPPFYVKQGKIYDSRGKEVKLFGVNWFGFETKDHVVHGLWARNRKDMIKQIKQLGFNAIRLPICPETLKGVKPSSINYNLNPDLKGLNSLQILDKVILELAKNGFYIVLDHHNPDCQNISETPEINGYTLEDWINDLKLLADRYKFVPNVIGIDIKNEPHGRARWGTGGIKWDWKLQSEEAAQEILRVNPNILIFVEGIQENHSPGQSYNCESKYNHFWGENIEPIQCYPLNIKLDKLVLAPHIYGPSVYMQPYFQDKNFPQNMPQIWEQHIGRFVGKYPIVIGEWGGNYEGLDKIWQQAIVDWFKKKNICNFFYWSWNPNSSDTKGLLKDDWKTINQEKYNNLKRLMDYCKGKSSFSKVVSSQKIDNNSSAENKYNQNKTKSSQFIKRDRYGRIGGSGGGGVYRVNKTYNSFQQRKTNFHQRQTGSKIKNNSSVYKSTTSKFSSNSSVDKESNKTYSDKKAVSQVVIDKYKKIIDRFYDRLLAKYKGEKLKKILTKIILKVNDYLRIPRYRNNYLIRELLLYIKHKADYLLLSF